MIVYHIPIKNFSAAEYIAIIERIKGKCTHLVIGELINCVEWETMLDFLPGSLYNDSKRYPGAMSLDEFMPIIKTCKSVGIEVIPDFRLFSHQRKSFLNLQDNEKAEVYAINDRTSKVTPEVILVQNLLINEICSVINPKIAYIGHDECFIEGTPLLNSGKLNGRPATSYEFKSSVLGLHQTFNKMGIRMAMSGDSFIERRKFPGVIGGANASPETARLLDVIPKDVIMVAWNYKGITPEVIQYFTNKGHDVIGLMFDTENTYPQLKTAIEGNPKAHPGLATWSRSRAGKDAFIEHFATYFMPEPPAPEPAPPTTGFWKWLKRIFK